jgi:hypothetical protein
MRIRLILKAPFTWETCTGVHHSKTGDFRAENFKIPETGRVSFEDFAATSQDGDTKESFYKYFVGRQYKLTLCGTGPKIGWATFEEV